MRWRGKEKWRNTPKEEADCVPLWWKPSGAVRRDPATNSTSNGRSPPEDVNFNRLCWFSVWSELKWRFLTISTFFYEGVKMVVWIYLFCQTFSYTLAKLEEQEFDFWSSILVPSIFKFNFQSLALTSPIVTGNLPIDYLKYLWSPFVWGKWLCVKYWEQIVSDINIRKFLFCIHITR